MLFNAFSCASCSFYKVARLLSLTLAASALAACAQSSVVQNGRQFRAAEGELALKAVQKVSPKASQTAPNTVQKRTVAERGLAPKVLQKAQKTAQKRTTAQSKKGTSKQVAGSKITSYGIASFYEYDTQTASGEKFDPHKMTAAHRTLPFGTRLRVTDVTTGRSVTVRVNDRGPFVPGRIVDLSYSAAQRLGIIDRGVARVKVAVLQ